MAVRALLSRIGCCVVAVGLLASACTGGASDGLDEDSTATSEELSSSQDNATTSTTAQTTTSEATTTTTEPLDPDEAAVLALTERFYGDRVDRPDRTKTPDQYPDVIGEIAVDPLLSVIRQADADMTALGQTQESYPRLYDVTNLTIVDDTARVTTCDLGRDALFSPDGDLLVPSAGSFSQSQLVMKRLDDRWLIEDWISVGVTEELQLCDPVELWGPFTTTGEPVNTDGEFDDVGDPAVVREVEDRFLEYLEAVYTFDEREQDVSELEGPIEEYATRTEVYWLNRLHDEQITQDTEANLVFDGWEIRIESVRVAGDNAEVLACGFPRSEYLSVDDDSLLYADTEPRWGLAYLVRNGTGTWQVEFFWKGSSLPCVL